MGWLSKHQVLASPIRQSQTDLVRNSLNIHLYGKTGSTIEEAKSQVLPAQRT